MIGDKSKFPALGTESGYYGVGYIQIDVVAVNTAASLMSDLGKEGNYFVDNWDGRLSHTFGC